MSDVCDHPEYQAQLRGVLAMPDDDLPRLVLADWLDEHREHERAEFIRCQVQTAAWGCDFRQTPEQPGWKHNCGTDENGYWLCQPLRSRAREHLEKHADQWFPVPSGFGLDWDIAVEDDADPLRSGYGIHRGFVHTVRCRLAGWIGETTTVDLAMTDGPYRAPITLTPAIGPRVVAEHPVETVRLAGLVRRSAVSKGGAIRRDDAGPLWPYIFMDYRTKPISGHVECDSADRLEELVSTAAIAWAKARLDRLA